MEDMTQGMDSGAADQPSPAPAAPQADGGIDLSAGLEPKAQAGGDIDLSAGLEPKGAAPARTGNTGIPGVLSGIGGGVMESAQGAMDLATKAANFTAGAIPGVKANFQSPQIPEEYKSQDTTSEKIGNFAENVGEFATGEEMLKGMTRLAKLEELAQKSPTIAKIIENTPDFIRKVIGSATKAATVGGAQGAVKGAAEGDAVGGAEGGAIGGAIGGAAGETVGAVAKPIAEKLGIATSSEQDAMRAFRPNKRNQNFLQNWSTAKDRLSKEIGEDGSFKNLQDAADRMRDVRQNIWNDEVKPEIDARAKNLFDTTSVADNISGKISDQMREHAPQEAKIMEDFAKKFENGRTVGDAEKDLEYFNAELDKQGYWKKSPKERAALEKVDGTVASRAAAVDALRDALYDHLEQNGAPGVKDLKKEYGAISSLENDIRGQANVEGRQKPISLKQMLGMGAGILHGGPMGVVTGIGVPLLDKMYNDPTALLNRAVAKGTPGPVREAVRDAAPVAGDLAKTAIAGTASDIGQSAGEGGFRTGSGSVAEGPQADEWMKVSDGQGHEWQVHPADFDEMRRRDPNVKPV